METLIKETALFNFTIQNGILLASWDDSVSAESDYFQDSIKQLFEIAARYKIKNVLLDSGEPAGGVLTEEVMNFVNENISYLHLKKIAVLESVDFHWDNNLLQFLAYLKSALLVSFEVKIFSCKDQALEWLSENS